MAITVYPRACGGTEMIRTPSSTRSGLSPRVRGNLLVGVGPDHVGGSIPARAGEPAPGSAAADASGVYPRACGGTGEELHWLTLRRGLSPRVRGNRVATVPREPTKNGSIPARAGEPPGGQGDRCAIGVYPRACGGTRQPVYKERFTKGLSPRVRGNPPRGP